MSSRKTLPMIPLVMARADLDGLEDIGVPGELRLRTFNAGDEERWAAVETAAGEFSDPARARERFDREFGPHLADMRERCLILETAAGEAIGTTTAWHDRSFQGQEYGRIHWVAVVPPHQGKGLGRLLVVKALLLMRRWHERAYLTTQTSSWVAVHLYLTLGFRPLLTAPEQEAGWQLLRDEVPHPLLGPPPWPLALGARPT